VRQSSRIRRAPSHRGPDEPLEKDKWRTIDPYLVSASLVVRVARSWPVRWEWRSRTPIIRIHDRVFNLSPTQTRQLAALRKEILLALDMEHWAHDAYDRGIENGWRSH